MGQQEALLLESGIKIIDNKWTGLVDTIGY